MRVLSDGGIGRRLGAVALWVGLPAALAGAAPAGAAELPGGTVSASASGARACTIRLADGPAVASLARTATRTGLVRARIAGAGDWDVALFDARSGRFVAGGAGPGDDLAEGFAAAGQRLVVQACHFAGATGAGTVTLENVGVDLGAGVADRLVSSVVAVRTATRGDKARLSALGLDPAEGATASTVDLVLHGPADAARLRRAGFTWTVRIPDLAAVDAANARADRAYAARTARSALPSGRDGYRHLADYEAELKALALGHPGLVRLVTLPHKSLLGRTILGVEIGRDVNVDRGLPTFLQLGVHHAREWPAGELPMEWAYELVNGDGKDARVTRLLESERNVIVPIVNPDGFNLTREAPVDLGNAAASINLPAAVDNPDVLPITDPTYTSALLLDQTLGGFAYKRRNCRIADGATPTAAECGNPTNRTRGVDPNRNYGGGWGGPGASADPTRDTYRGAAPFSEPEVQNVRELVSGRQVTALITNHTFQGLVLRVPGLKADGPPVDEVAYKALGDAMAGQNGYVSKPSYQLYDTSGGTEDWSYPATGGFGFTFEIGKDEFHPPYEDTVKEYTGPTDLGGAGGNRGAYFLAAEWAAKAGNHSVLTGRAPAGTTLRLRKTFTSQTKPVFLDDSETTTRPAVSYVDTLDSHLVVGRSGRFTWHVNPSTRPAVAKPIVTSDVASTPAQTIDISASRPPSPATPDTRTFTVPPGAARQLVVTTTGTLGQPALEDIDLELYEGDAKPVNRVGTSGKAGADEEIVLNRPTPGARYTLLVRNYASVAPYAGRIAFYGDKPGTVVTRPAPKEDYALTCERGGRVLSTRKVQVDRGQVRALGDACAATRPRARSRLRLTAAVTAPRAATAARSGIPVRVRCAVVRCATVQALATVDGATAKRLGLAETATRTTVGRSAIARAVGGRRTLALRLTPAAATALRRAHGVRLTVTVVATDSRRLAVARTLAARLG